MRYLHTLDPQQVDELLKSAKYLSNTSEKQ